MDEQIQKLDAKLFSRMVNSECSPSNKLRFLEMAFLLIYVGQQLGLPPNGGIIPLKTVEPLLHKEENEEVVQECWRLRRFQVLREWSFFEEIRQKMNDAPDDWY